MEKRIFLAILISLGLLWGWAALAPRIFPELAKKPTPAVKPADPITTTTTTDTATSSAAAATTTSPASATAPTSVAGSPVTATPIAADRVQLTVVETPEYKAILTNRGAQLISFELKKYLRKKSKEPEDLVKVREPHRSDYPFTIVPAQPALLGLNTALYAVSDVEANGQRVVEYRYSDGRVTATKTFRFSNQPYLFDFSVSIQPPTPYRVAVGPGIRTLAAAEQDTQVVTTGNGI